MTFKKNPVWLALILIVALFLITAMSPNISRAADLLKRRTVVCHGPGKFSFSLDYNISADWRGVLAPESDWILLQPTIAIRSPDHAKRFEQLAAQSNRKAYGDKDVIFVTSYVALRPLLRQIVGYHSVASALNATEQFRTDFDAFCESDLMLVDTPQDLLTWGERFGAFRGPTGVLLQLYLNNLVLQLDQYKARYENAPLAPMHREFYERSIQGSEG